MNTIEVEKPLNSDEQAFWDKAMISTTAGLLASDAKGTANDFVVRALLIVSTMLVARRESRA